jgi:hypothetical protein
MVRPPGEDRAPGRRPQPNPSAAKSRPLEVDSSPTVVMRSDSIDFSSVEDE